MRLYFATPKLNVMRKLANLQPDYKPNILLSFGSKNADKYSLLTTARYLSDSIILDCGTWTEHACEEYNRGRITIDGYEDYLGIRCDKYDFIFNYDESFAENKAFETNSGHQERLESSGFKPIYVLHSTIGEEIDYCLKRKYDYVAIGSSSLSRKADTEEIVNRLAGNGIKAHLFGCAKFGFLESAPVFSCDSASWTKTANKTDAILYWNPHLDQQHKIKLDIRVDSCDKGAFCYPTYPYKDELEEYLWDNFEFDHGNLMATHGPDNRRLVNMFYYMNLEKRINAIHAKLGFPW